MMFHTYLDIRVVDDCGPRPTIRLLSPFIFESNRQGVITVPEGFQCDGASIPRAAMSITGWPGVRAAVVHDYLLSTGLARRECDKVFFEALQVCEVEEVTARIMYEAVRSYSRMIEGTQANGDDSPYDGA